MRNPLTAALSPLGWGEGDGARFESLTSSNRTRCRREYEVRAPHFNVLKYAINAFTSPSENFSPNAVISPFTPFRIRRAIQSSARCNLCKSGPSSPVASSAWQCAQFFKNNVRPMTAGIGEPAVGASPATEFPRPSPNTQRTKYNDLKLLFILAMICDSQFIRCRSVFDVVACRTFPHQLNNRAPADWQSAIQQASSLRYRSLHRITTDVLHRAC